MGMLKRMGVMRMGVEASMHVVMIAPGAIVAVRLVHFVVDGFSISSLVLYCDGLISPCVSIAALRHRLNKLIARSSNASRA